MQLVLRDPQLPKMLVGNLDVPKPNEIDLENLVWIEWCPAEVQKVAREKLLGGLLKTHPTDWNIEVVRFVCKNTVDSRIASSLRKAILVEPANEPLSPTREMALEFLAKNAVAADYPWLLSSLREDSPESALIAAWSGFSRLPILQPKEELPLLAKLMVQSQSLLIPEIPAQAIATRLRNVTKQLRLGSAPTGDTVVQWLPFFKQSLAPEVYNSISQQSATPPRDWAKVVAESSQIAGDKTRGAEVYRNAKCAQCHGGNNALGPSLSGVAQRFSRNDLFRAIYEPSKDISDRYRAIKILTSSGTVVTGLKIYDSADGVTLQSPNGKLIRINEDEIESKESSNVSLMPANLLDAYSAKDVSDLYAYLRSL